MQGEFEKQVQQKMEELKLVPSEPVWQKVQAEINKKKERRRIVFILLFLSAATAAVLWWTKGTSNTAHTSQSTTAQNKTVIPDTKQITNQSTAVTIHKEKNIQTEKALIEKHKEMITAPHVDKPGVIESNGKVKNERSGVKNNKQVETDQSSATHSHSQMINESSIGNKGIKEYPTNIPVVIGNNKKIDVNNSPTKNPSTLAEKNTPAINYTDSTINNPVENRNKETIAPMNNSLFNKDYKDSSVPIQPMDTVAKKKIAKTKKWEKMITVETGWSGYSVGPLNYNGLSLNANPVTASSGFTLYTPNETTKGISFSIGIGVMNKANERFEFDAGLQFHYYSTHVKVGKRVDSTLLMSGPYPAFASSTARGYYTSTSINDYTNKFGIIEVPVSLHYQLLKKTPLRISLGAAYGHLLKTNALTFNNGNGNYYYDEANIIHNYFSMFSSLQYQFNVGHKLKLRMGPMVQVITPFETAGYYSNSNLFFTALKTDIIF